MATYETSKSKNKSGVGHGWNRQVIEDFVCVAMTTAMLDNANDDVGLLWLPAGAIVLGASVKATDMDSGAALLIDIGDSADEDRIFAAVNAQAAVFSNTIASTGYQWKTTAATQIRAYINTAAGTAVAGTLCFSIRYVIDPDYVTTALVAA
jgi:hypothetical protein